MSPQADVLLYTPWANKEQYRELLQERGLKTVYPEDVSDWDSIRFAVCWDPEPGLLGKCPNLAAIMSMGAGVDHIMRPGQTPEHLPILRIADPVMAVRMATWVVWGVINWQRRMEDYAAAQRAARWDLDIEGRSNRDSHQVRVGVMGFGVMGRKSAESLLALGYQVSAWSRTHKQHPDIRCFAGEEQLQEFVSQADVLVCLLPLTPSTHGIINARLLGWLPPGGAVINGGRGKQLVEADLLAALDAGRLDFALLDVFDPEPLPPQSRLWAHPRVRLTPHVASMTTLETAADQIAANYHSVVAGAGPLPANLVDRSAGY